MVGADWGPVPELAKRLAALDRGPIFRRPAWWRPIANRTSLWHLYANGEVAPLGGVALFPTSLLPRRPTRVPRIRHWLGVAVPGAASAGPPVFRPSELKASRELASSIAACAAWLGARNHRFIAKLMGPFWDSVPTDFCAVSTWSVIRSLYAWQLATVGPGASMDRVRLAVFAGPIGPALLPGDLIAVHLLAEALVGAPPVAILKSGPADPSPHRRAGGFRTKSFLVNYPQFRASRNWAAKAWLDALRPIVVASPLTRLIYPDLLLEPVTAADIAPVASIGDRVHASGGQVSGEWWRDLWISQIARSMLGAVLSGVPVDDELLALEKTIEALELPPQGGRQERKLRLARAAADSAKTRVIPERARKLKLLADALNPEAGSVGNDPDEPVADVVQPETGEASKGLGLPSYLHARLLDMLVRVVVTRASPRMVEDWRTRKSKDPRARLVWADREKIVYLGLDELALVLLDRRLADLLSGLDRAQVEALRGGLNRLLALPEEAGDPKSDFATRAGVPAVYANSLRRRLVDDDYGVALPFPGLTGPTPGQLLTRWRTDLSNLLAPSVEVTVETTEETTEY